MAGKRRKRKRLTPGLGSLRSRRPRLPGRRSREPVAEPVDYGPDVQRLDDAVLALGDRVDQAAGREG